jgi:hypothetical protein
LCARLQLLMCCAQRAGGPGRGGIGGPGESWAPLVPPAAASAAASMRGRNTEAILRRQIPGLEFPQSHEACRSCDALLLVVCYGPVVPVVRCGAAALYAGCCAGADSSRRLRSGKPVKRRRAIGRHLR